MREKNGRNILETEKKKTEAIVRYARNVQKKERYTRFTQMTPK